MANVIEVSFSEVVDYILSEKVETLHRENEYIATFTSVEEKFNIKLQEEDYNDLCNRMFEREVVSNVYMTTEGFVLVA